MEPRNEFQVLMKRWTSLGPYNALHIMRLTGHVDVQRWQEALAAPVAALGFQQAVEIETNYAELTAGVREELNKPFSAGASPLRFFAINNAGGTHYFGVTFDHWIADSQSIRLLMRRIFANYQSPESSSGLPLLRVSEKSFHKLFDLAGRLAAAKASVQNYLRHRRAYRIPINEPLDFSADFQHLQLPEGLIGAIRHCSKKLGASVNDIFLAAAMQALGSYTAADRAKAGARKPGKARDRIGFSVAVDIRPLALESLDDVFGFFLSYYTTLLENPETVRLEDLVKVIASHTKEAKSRQHALRLFNGFRLANMFWNFSGQPRHRALMLHRALPLLGGISNVNLTDSWIGRDGHVLDYIRVSPVGPLLPIVFTLTTIQNRLSLCVTHRATVFSKEQAAEITRDFVQRLTALQTPAS